MESGLAATRNRGIVDDPVALQVVWTRLIAIADESAATLRRTSFSPIVRESNDFACVIFDAEGNAMAENTIGIPSFNMTLSRTLAHFLKIRPAPEWRPGDVGICNDPWLTSGHLPDITIVAPVFAGTLTKLNSHSSTFVYLRPPLPSGSHSFARNPIELELTMPLLISP